jgi:hypothetical protein
MINENSERANIYRSKANELRATAAGMTDPDSRQILLRLAETYDGMAGTAARRAATEPFDASDEDEKSAEEDDVA